MQTLHHIFLFKSKYHKLSDQTIKPQQDHIMFFFSFPVRVKAELGGNVTLPCWLLSRDSMSFGGVGMRVKWTKVADDEAMNEDVLLSMGFHKKTYGSFENRVFMQEQENEDASLVMTDVSKDDMGKYRCEIINGFEDTVHEIILEVEGDLTDGKCLFFFHLAYRNAVMCKLSSCKDIRSMSPLIERPFPVKMNRSAFIISLSNIYVSNHWKHPHFLFLWEKEYKRKDSLC